MQRRDRATCLALLFSLVLAGCPAARKASETKKATTPLRVVVVDDDALADAIEREWKARSEGELPEIRRTTSAKISAAKRLAADVVIYPSGLLGEMAHRGWIVPLPDDTLRNPELDAGQILPLVRHREIVWGGKLYALPLGSPQLLMVYRQDIFSRLEIEPPRTWSEYQQVVERLADRAALGDLAPPADQPWQGAAEPLGPGWGGLTLLARAAAYARHQEQESTAFDYQTMKPLIDGPPFRRALEELAAVARHAPSPVESPRDALRTLTKGHCAIALSWPSHDGASGSSEPANVSDPARYGFAELPGSPEAYSSRLQAWERRMDEETWRVPLLGFAGRMGSVTREAASRRAATSWLILITGDTWPVCSASSETTMFRATDAASAQRWIGPDFNAEAGRGYVAAIASAQLRARWMFVPRIPGRTEYLAALDKAVKQVVAGQATPEEALAAAAQTWAAITQSRGAESQLHAYHRSLDQ